MRTRRELLAGLSLPDAAPFEEWLLMQRENLHQQQLAALHRLAAAYEQAGLFEKAQQFYNSPEYTAARKLREGAATAQFVAVEGS